MPILTVDGQEYNYPANRTSPSWGEDATAWSVAVTDVLSNVSGTGDILQTAANIANGQAVAANVTGLSFDGALLRGAIVEYSIYRVTTGSGSTEKVEIGTAYLSYKSTAATWDIVVVGGSGAGVTLSITSLGQVQYISTTFTGSSYSGTIRFRARAFTI